MPKRPRKTSGGVMGYGMPPKNAQGNMSSIDTVSLKFYVVSRQLNQTFDELVVTKLSA